MSNNPQRDSRLQKLAQLEELGINAYPHIFKPTAKAAQIAEKYKDLAPETKTEDTVKVAGRVYAYRNSGMFMDIQDEPGKIQIFAYKGELDELNQKILKSISVGDIIGVEGTISTTQTGELTVRAKTITMLAKNILPPPEKFHGLQDHETKYRQRYLDLISNKESRDLLRNRFLITQEIRNFLQNRGFIEVETPTLQTKKTGASAKPFITHHNTLDMDMFLRIAPELFLKRLIIGGFEKVFEIGKNFRNEGIDTTHNPEFTMLELYEQYADYNDMMTLFEDLIGHLTLKFNGTYDIEWNGHKINLKPPFKRASMIDLIKEYLGKEIALDSTLEDVRKTADELDVHYEDRMNWGQIIEEIFDLVEPKLIQPIHVIDYPKDLSPLTKQHRLHPRLVERFETRIGGKEISNAYSELSDPRDQRCRMEDQANQAKCGNDEAEDLDEDFITALEYGMAPTGGMGIGIDRLVMLLTGTDNIRDIIAFPTLKEKAKKE
ncbi:MAG: lysine--tRNA ligase [Rickettsiales bacterium]|jgi:lysyl-tRNA synthetase class 2|nr:lysine--tRNA ligase [Rickettsiales bacterium]